MVEESAKALRRLSERLPIKVILPKQGKERAVPGGGSPPTPFRTVDAEYRARLTNQLNAIVDTSSSLFRRLDAVPVRLKLLGRAAAKSHRPDNLFSNHTCPIVGAGALGELFLKATPHGLAHLTKMVASNESDRIVKELSTVESVEPITPFFRLRGNNSFEILKKSPRGDKGFIARVRLFDYGLDSAQEQLVENFVAACKSNEISVKSAGYSLSSYIYAVECETEKHVEALSRIVGVRSISPMPLVRIVRPNSLEKKTLPENLPSRDDVQGDIPVVVVVDTGISTNIQALQSWIVGEHSDVSPQYRNPAHGTFVGGLVCWGSHLNPHLQGLDEGPCGIFNLQVVPNNDPSVGETDTVTESELLQSLESALKSYANQYKVWNLSLGTSEVCGLDEFSALAESLDNLQEQYQVTFVICAGNYDKLPMLDYPRLGDQLAEGRIASPADSVLGITVGSISHIDYAKNGPKTNHPAPFSRHGAGPNHIIKPDMVHYGGTCSLDRSHQSGVRSVTEDCSAEDLGTSFATPLVARTLAQIYHQITPTPSPVLARALLTHHARDPRNGERVPDGEENFFGFGLPTPPPYCLECTPYSATLVFEDALRPGYYLEWDDFPYPTALHRSGRYFGEVSMTVAFAPSRGARWGTEYCETHIDAHLGVYFNQTSRTTGEVTEKFRGLVPPEHRNPGQMYEAYQVEKLRKWAPVRTYHGDLGEKGERGNRWRLMVRLLTRHGIDSDSFSPQPFSLIVTISDPLSKASVYDEVAQLIRTRFKAQNLAVRTAARVRMRSEPPSK